MPERGPRSCGGGRSADQRRFNPGPLPRVTSPAGGEAEMSDFLSSSGGNPAAGAAEAPVQNVLGQLMGGRQDMAGLSGLLDQLRQGGLGPQVDSWIGHGENAPVAPAELENALGPAQVEQIAQRTGLPRQGLMSLLVALLPLLVDRLSPQGRLPQDDTQVPQGGIGGVLGGLLGQLGAGGGQGGGLGGLLGQLGAGGGQGGGLGGILGGLLGGRGR
ncbi:YidB family protein [Roseomonas sp. BN140053]|uniref:YidB family protein n=1 Tax=Roseomonas sp. BN140053 TaxID=3391898 RepID=UPI0039EA12E1